LTYKNICKVLHGKSVLLQDKKFLYSDVDETLLLWPENPHEPKNSECIKIPFNGIDYYLKPHKKNIELLKNCANMDYRVVLWSMGGERWAKEVCKVLDLENYVDYCLAKPDLILDDLNPSNWMPENLFQEDNED